MKKLVTGIVDFRKNVRPKLLETFERLAQGQFPDTLFITCSDSRVAPNWFASTDPGDLFVIRNVGNLVPRCGKNGLSDTDESEAAAIEFAIMNLGVKDIVVCGHSECGAMFQLMKGREKISTPNLKAWLRHADVSLESFQLDLPPYRYLAAHNRLSQINVIKQVENLMTYPIIQEKLAQKKIRVHGWWFELANATVHFYDYAGDRFVPLDETTAASFMSKIED